MLPLWTVWIFYGAPVICICAVGYDMRSQGNREKLSRAFLLAGVAGIVVPILTYACYALFARESAPPPPGPVHSLNDFFFELGKAIGPAIAYQLGFTLYPLVSGILSIPVTFLGSFLFPLKRCGRIVGEPSTSSG